MSRLHHASRRALVTLAIAVLCCAVAPASLAQSTATLSGTVTDATGSVVPGVEVTVLNAATALQRQATTNSQGIFRLVALPPGNYSLTALLTGFTPLGVERISLKVGDEIVLALTLKVAGIGESVTVAAEPATLSRSGAVGTVIDRAFVESLPLNGRTFQSLLTLTPGLVLTGPTGSTGYLGGQFSANGQRTLSNYFMVDGVSANLGISSSGLGLGPSGGGAQVGLAANGGTNTLVSMEAFREVRILTSTFAPEYGRTPGAQVSIVTRSGTNAFSGSAFEYFRDDRLDATDWFVNSRGGAKPQTSYNNFGGVFSGPLRRNRAFFFGSYEGQRIDEPKFVISQVPSRAVRSQAPPELRRFLDVFPLPTGPDAANNLAEFSASYARPSTVDAASLRLDLTIARGHTAFIRINRGVSTNSSRGGVSGLQTLSFVQADHTETETWTTGATSVLGRSVVNDARLNYSAHRIALTDALDEFGGATPTTLAGLIASSADPDATYVQFNLFRGAGGVTVLGRAGGNAQRQFNVVDTFTYSRGTHELKAGVDYRRLMPEPSPPTTRYTYLFNNIAELVQNRVLRISIDRVVPARPVFDSVSTFLQDVFNLSSRVTLTYGLRYEVNPPPKERGALQPFLLNLADPSSPRPLPAGSPLWTTGWGNVAPRVGISYRLADDAGHETVLHGGWGRFYDLSTARAGDVFGAGFPYVTRNQYNATTFPQPDRALTPPSTLPEFPGATDAYAFPSDLALPRTYQWNASIDRGLGPNQTLTVSYVGAIGRELLYWESFNYGATNPNIQLVQSVSNASSSDYHALQAHFVRRLSHGLQALASYTWSKSTDTDSFQSAGPLPPAARTPPESNRGPSDFDVRHVLNGTLTVRPQAAMASRAARAALNGWQIDLVGAFRTGLPITPMVFRDIGYGGYWFRPDLVPGIPLYVDDPASAGGRRINRAAFAVPAEPRQGTLPRNSLRGASLKQIDLALSRTLNLKPPVRAQARIEVFNLFNIPNFGPPDTTLTSLTFGQATKTFANGLGSGTSDAAGGLNPLHQVGGPRSVQLAFRVYF